MLDPLSFFAISSLIVKSAPLWLPPIRDAFLGKARDKGMDLLFDTAIDKGKKGMRSLLHSDEKEQARHLELVLKNALERGEIAFHTPEEQRQYRSIITTLCQPGPHSETLRREVMRLFSLNENPKFTELNEVYHRLLPQSTSSSIQTPVDAALYLSSFFDALLAELYADSFFRQQLSDVIQVRAAMSMQRSLTEVVTTLRQIGETLADHYTPEQFELDVQAYTEHIERTLRYLKLVGVVPKERTHENRAPELDGIFVPLRIEYRDQPITPGDQTIIDVLENSPCLVLLGGPGSGKSTAVRHLAWSHAVANQSDSATLTNAPLLPGKPLPLRIELRRLNEDRKQRPDYDFLTYASEVLLGRAGLDIPPQMFELLLERRTMLILFDGLDEVATLDDRRTLGEEIESFAQRYPGNHFLVTSRPVGYELAPLSGQIFSHAQIQPFDDQQIQTFLEHWYAHVLRLSPLFPDDRQELEELYTALKDNPRLHSLAENPLLLTVITALHRYERLPDKRILVYDRCADLLLETWARLKGTNIRWQDPKLGKLELETKDQYACVAHLGFVLHKRAQEQENVYGSTSTVSSAVDVPSRFMLQEIERFLHQQGLFASKAEEHLQARRFLDLVQEEAGLIVERGTDENGEPLYGFVHRTFQEYFSAADVYERYRQEEEPTIISEFLSEHLHDPHWLEVILLLFGKLGRKPATRQLRQILEGKLKSRRSKYTEIVQHDLFFISTCLMEEILVENDLAAYVIAHLSELVKSSPFPSQRRTAAGKLDALTQARQYAQLARQELKALAARSDLNIEQSIQIADAFAPYLSNPAHSEIHQLVAQILFELIQRSDLSVEFAIQVAERLYRHSSHVEESQRLATQLLSDLARRSDLSAEQAIQATWCLYKYSPEESEEQLAASQMLLQIPQRHDFTIEQVIRAARLLAEQQSPGTEYADANSETQWATQLLLSLTHRSDLSSKQLIQVVAALNTFANFYLDEGSWTAQTLLEIAQHADLTFEETTLIIRLLGIEESTGILFTLAQRSDLSIEQTIQVVQLLRYRITPGTDLRTSEEMIQANKMLLALTQRSDLSLEESIQVIQAFYDYGYRGLQPDLWISQQLLALSQSSNLTIEQYLRVVTAVYEYSDPETQERRWATQKLTSLAQQNFQAAQALYICSDFRSQEQELASLTLLSLAQRPDISTEQLIQVTQSLCEKAKGLYESGGNEANIPELQEVLQLSIQILSNITQCPDLPGEQIIQVTGLLYKYCLFELEEERQRLTQLLWELAQNHSFSRDQKVQIVMLPLQSREASFSDKAQALKIALSLLPKEKAKDNLQYYINPSRFAEDDMSLLDISIAVELSRQELLPTDARDEMYQTLNWMVAQFDKLEEFHE